MFEHMLSKPTIRRRLFIYFLIVLIPMLLLLGTVVYWVSTSTMEEYIIQSSAQIVDQVTLHLDLKLDYIQQGTLTVTGNRSVADFLKLEPADLFDVYVKSNNIKENLFNSLVFSKEDLEGMFLLGYNGLFLSSGSRTERFSIFDGNQVLGDLPWLKKLPSDGNVLLTSVSSQSYSSNLPVISIARQVVNPDNPSTPLGIFWIDVSFAKLQQLLQQVKLGSSGFLVVLDSHGSPLIVPDEYRFNQELLGLLQDQEQVGITQLNGEKVIISSKKSAETGWLVAAVVPFQEVAGGIAHTKYIIGLVVLLCIVLSSIISVKFASSITRPIERLEQMMSEASKGYLGGVIPVEKTDEVGRLTNNFNRMLRKIQTLIQEMYHSRLLHLEAQSKQQLAELKALQAQINPHFLFNTLNVINSMAVLEEQESISKMVTTLGDFFRYNMETEEIVVPLEQELEQVSRYMSIQQLRFGDRICLELDVEPNFHKQEIIKLSLQPLVENACIHGLELNDRQVKGVIRISTVLTGDMLRITVTDNGKGIEPAKVREIDKVLRDPNVSVEEMEGHVGIINVCSRLRLHYGPDAKMRVNSELGVGTSVQIWIPHLMWGSNSNKLPHSG